MQGIAGADARLHAERPLAFEHVEIDDLAARQDAEVDGLVEALAELLHLRLAGLAKDFVRAARVRQAPQADAGTVAVGLRVVLHESQRGEGPEVSEHGGLGQGRIAHKLVQRRRLGRLADELQHLHRLQHGLDEVAIVKAVICGFRSHAVPPEGTCLS